MLRAVVLRAAPTRSAPGLVLRPWTDADAGPLLEAYRDPVLRRFTIQPVRDDEDAARWLVAQRDGWDSGRRFSFAVLQDGPDPGAAPLVANVVLKLAGSMDGYADVGYWTAGYARGRGIAPRAVEALTAWAFGTFAGNGLDRLALVHQVDNHASCRVAEKTGYAFARILPARPPFPREGHLHVRHWRVTGPSQLGHRDRPS
ncbi:GNAT family N-acetyltransferase [Rugosimonospora africana]|uniref:GNAT family N-acetyltransferase n=1 Tax=Rugosimonospora africana TaxID=556532 RepID=UPI001EF18F78|nr:GNAT family N-acetyltransferase [Rugosimonospora africana]